MIGKTGCRNLLESVGNDAKRFVNHWTHLLGVTDEQGNRHRDFSGNMKLKAPDGGERINPKEVSIRGLAESLLGEDAVERYLNPNVVRNVLEDNGAGAVGPSSFANINAFTAATAGLLEAAILEGWQNPQFIQDVIAPVEPSRQFEGRKTIGVSRIGDLAETREPLMPTKRVQLGEKWIVQPRTVENALAVEVSQEAVYLDLTGSLVNEANDLGTWLGYRKELRCIDSFIGVVNSYNYKGTSYNTYISNGYYNNDLSGSNELLYIDNVLAAEVLFRDMKDPDTNTRVLIMPNTLLVNREKGYVAEMLLGSNEAQYRSAPGATTGEQSFRTGNNPIKSKYRILESPLVYERCLAADGLNLSAANAGKSWWLFEAGQGTHVYVQNVPLRTQSAAPNQIDMIDRGLVLFVKADERGIPMWKQPRKVVRSR